MNFEIPFIDFYNDILKKYKLIHLTNNVLTCKNCKSTCRSVYSIPINIVKNNILVMDGVCCSYLCLHKFVTLNTDIKYLYTKNILYYIFHIIFN